MLNFYNKKYTDLYITIAKLSRAEFFYNDIKLDDKLETRIYLIFVHFSLIFVIFKNQKIEKKITQKIFDNLFQNIEYHLREQGMGDVTVNKKMKELNRIFYDILLKIRLPYMENNEVNMDIIKKYLVSNTNMSINKEELSKYFKNFFKFCFSLDSKDIIKGKIYYNHGCT
ncbi:MAG: hypothetical protein CL687_02510 [Candidatus Pelagibacter sp.]|nr:hypothetical protein [Candidatus Pelagibacter sp.]|tara:strand:- start:1184 stop:1693 length:510 start_codon:yes stop_codon:yes gene_type:complete